MSPDTQVLVVGAGPTGLTCAIALAKLGISVIIVDSSPTNQNGARSVIMHSHTLEVLKSLEVEKKITENSIQCNRIYIRGGTNSLMEYDLSVLRGLTEFPFSVLIPQDQVEKLFREELISLGVRHLWNKTVIGFDQSGDSGVNVMFEDGSTLRAKYVVGADGSRSTVRKLCMIGFTDPSTGIAYDDASVSPSYHMVFADIIFEDPMPAGIPKDGSSFHCNTFFLCVPLRAGEQAFWRVAIGIPPQDAKPPQNPSKDYFQQLIDERNPWDTRMIISTINAASRYRVRSAVASTYFKKLGQGKVVLAGDAAHVHSPVGGQGMNLGICDAAAAARAIKKDMEDESSDIALQGYADSRHRIGIKVISMASGMTTLANANLGWKRLLRDSIFRIIWYLPFLNRLAAWRISGLANRDT